LAYLEQWGSIVVCRHGIIHIRWGNVSIRLQIETFQRLASLVDRGSSLPPPFSFSDGDLAIVTEEPDYRVTIGSVELVLTADGWLAFDMIVGDGAYRLEQFLARDDWPEEPESVPFEYDLEELMRPHRFSPN
jgi:hypothetical protein